MNRRREPAPIAITVVSTAPDGAPVVHSCPDVDAEAAAVALLRTLGHTDIGSTRTLRRRAGPLRLDVRGLHVHDREDEVDPTPFPDDRAASSGRTFSFGLPGSRARLTLRFNARPPRH